MHVSAFDRGTKTVDCSAWPGGTFRVVAVTDCSAYRGGALVTEKPAWLHPRTYSVVTPWLPRGSPRCGYPAASTDRDLVRSQPTMRGYKKPSRRVL